MGQLAISEESRSDAGQVGLCCFVVFHQKFSLVLVKSDILPAEIEAGVEITLHPAWKVENGPVPWACERDLGGYMCSANSRMSVCVVRGLSRGP